MSHEAVKLGIVIVHYNSSADLDRCLDSLTAYPASSSQRIVIIDNASREEGLAEVHRRYPDFDWVFNTDNAGYAKGCNQGMARLDAEYFLILNPDIVVKPGALDCLLEFADSQPRAGLIGPQLLNEDGTIQDSCRRFYTFRTLLLRRTFLGRIFPGSETVRRHLMGDFDHRSSRPVDWVLGGCILVRRSALERTGPMDERFFLYFEDVDWCYRMWQAGFEVVYAPDARFVHRHRRDSAQGRFNRSFWLHLGSLISFYEKWGIVVWLLKKWRGPLLVFLLWALDMAGLAAAFGLAYGVRDAAGRFFSEPLYPFAEYQPILMFSLVLASSTFLLTGRYRPVWLRRPPGIAVHLQQIGILAVLLLAATYLGHLDVVSRAVLLMFIPLLALITGLAGRFFHRLLRRLERGNLVLERTLLCGGAQAVQEWLESAADPASEGIDVAGYVADPSAAGGAQPALGGGSIPWLGAVENTLEVVRRYRISQVVFWQRPAVGDRSWSLIAALRRQRVKLRWQLEDVWLLAAADRTDLFGGQPSAIQEVDGEAAMRGLGRRALAVGAGLLLGILGVVPWLWLRLIRFRSNAGGRFARIPVDDRWGGSFDLTLAVDGNHRVLPLIWQWPLTGALLRGRLGVAGPRPLPVGQTRSPASAAEILAFWRNRPAAPGLTGSGAEWEAAALSAGGRRARWNELWRNPGGFGLIPEDPRDDSEADPKRLPNEKEAGDR